MDGLDLDGLGAANCGPKHVGGIPVGCSLVASFGQEGVQGGPGDCLLPILGSHPEGFGLWLSAITELPPLQLQVEMVSDLCQKPSSRKSKAVVLSRLDASEARVKCSGNAWAWKSKTSMLRKTDHKQITCAS